MSEKTTLLPTATTPGDPLIGDPTQSTTGAPPPHTSIPMSGFAIAPGLEFDPSRKYCYGLQSLAAAILIFVSYLLVIFRDCSWGPGIDLDTLQTLHICMMILAFLLYILSLFAIADYMFQHKFAFIFGILLIYTIVGLMIWMSYEAVFNPCIKTFGMPIDMTPYSKNKNVFSRGDAVGIFVFLFDVIATILMFLAAVNFYKRY